MKGSRNVISHFASSQTLFSNSSTTAGTYETPLLSMRVQEGQTERVL